MSEGGHGAAARSDAGADATALRHRGQRAVRRLLEYAPASGSLALWAEHRDLDPPPNAGEPAAAMADRREAALRRREQRAGPTPQAPAALDEPPVFTDGRTLFYLPSFESLDLAQQTGWVAHEVLHLALRHVQRLRALRTRRGSVDAVLFNRCADAIVNSSLSHLSWLALPEGALTLPVVLAEVLGRTEGDEAALLAWDVERLYQAVDDRRPARVAASPRPARRGLVGLRGRSGADGAGAGGQGRDGRGSGEPAGGGSAPLAQDARDGATRDRAASGPPSDAPADAHEDGPTDPTGETAPRTVDGPRAARLRALATGIPRDLADRLPPDAQPEPPQAEAALAREWAERLLRGHAGDGAFSILRVLPADAGRSATPWELLLRSRLNRALAPRVALSASRPTRSWVANQGRGPGGLRLPFAPGVVGSRTVPRLCLVLDLSGSIDEGLLARFGREVDAIVRRQGAALTLVLGDDAVRAVRHHDPARQRLDLAWVRVAAGGGTDFAPLIAEALRHRPDLIVLLTDLDGPCGPRPPVPVLWAVPWVGTGREPPRQAPFGRVLRLR